MSEENPQRQSERSNDVGIFGQEEDADRIKVSPTDRIQRAIDQFLYAPLRIAWSDWRARIGGLIIVFYVFMGTVGLSLVSEPSMNEAPLYESPFQNLGYPLGTDGLGQPVGRQIVHATPAMLKMALAGVLFSVGVGAFIGLISGYKGGAVDRVLMTFTDIILTLPGLPVIIIIASIYPPRDPFMVGVILSIDSWPGTARGLRSQVLTIREESYVEAARTMGIPATTIINRDIIPQLAPLIIIGAAGAATGVIGTSVGLYFLGILPFTTLNWGVMMNLAHTTGGALANPGRAGHWLFFPAFALFGLGFGLTLFSQGMDRVFNPRLRARHAKTVADDQGGPDEEEEDSRAANALSRMK